MKNNAVISCCPIDQKVGRFEESRERDCALARAECMRDLKKAREAWMSAEKVGTRRARPTAPSLIAAVSCQRGAVAIKMKTTSLTFFGGEALFCSERRDTIA